MTEKARIAKTAVIHPNVKLGNGVVIEDYAVIGCPPDGSEPGELETVIGDFSVIRSHAVIYAGNRIGRRFRAGNKSNVRESNEIGDDVSIGSLAAVEHHVRIEDGVRIHTGAFIPEYSVLRREAWIGPHSVLTNSLYPTSPAAKSSLRGPEIGEKARIGANSTILPGVTVGKNSLVGAGSVVTKDVDEDGVWAGNPARRIKSIDDLPYGEE